MNAGVLPMFPLGTVLYPGGVLPLRVFEPRYRMMVTGCLEGDPRFGVALIERGSEVGGGDVRTDLGCVAGIAEARELPTGEFLLVCVGMERIRVVEWLPDDPAPAAVVEAWPDPRPEATEAEAVWGLEGSFRSVLGLAARLGSSVPIDAPLSDDALEAAYEMATLAPFGPLDRQRVLGAPDLGARALALGDLLAEQDLLLRGRLGDL